MKKILLILLFSFAFNFVFAQQAFFDRYNDKEGVSTIYISATMLKMMGNVQAGNKAGTINVEAKTKKLKGTISIKVK